MKQQWLDRYGFGIVFLVAWMLHAVLWGDLMWQSDQFLFSPFGDGAKNAYTFSYHILYGEGLHFSGMNYPYGDHLLYADAMPFYSAILSFLNGRLFTLDVADTIFLFNGILFAAMIISAPIIYLLLRAYRLPFLFSALAALSVCLLQPQFSRLSGHYSLSMMYWLPLAWYLLLRVLRARQKIGWLLGLGVLLLIHFYIHPYLGMIAASFVLGVYLVKLLIHKRGWWQYAYLLLVIALPLAIFQGVMTWTDPHPEGRQPVPWGFWEYQADINGVLLPPEHFFRGFLTQFIGYPPVGGEGRAYIGFISTLGLLFLLLMLIAKLVQKKRIRPYLQSELSHFFLASLLLLLFSMGIPFVWGLEGLLDYFSFIRQFRSIGRFAWPFFYTSFVATMLFYYQHLRLLRIKGLGVQAQTLMILLFAFLFAEAKSFAGDEIAYARKWQSYGQHYLGLLEPERYNFTHILHDAGYTATDFQAILPVPFENLGSEEITYQKESNALYMMTATSLHTGLPAFGVNMSRAVLEQSFNQQRLVSINPEPNPLTEDLPSDKPILMVVSKENPQYINRQEQFYIQQADTVAEHAKAWLLQLDPVYLDSFPRAEYPLLLQKEPQPVARYTREGHPFYAADSTIQIYYQSFDKKEGVVPVGFGKGALPSRTAGEEVALIPTDHLTAGPWELSIWAQLNLEEAFFGSIRLALLNKNQEVRQEWEVPLYRPDEIYQDWIQTRIALELAPQTGYLRIRTDDNTPKVLDEILFMPAGAEVWYPISDQLINYNGHLVNLNDVPVALSEKIPSPIE